MTFLNFRSKRRFLDSCAAISNGSLRLKTPEGSVLDFGSGEPAGEMHIRDWAAVSGKPLGKTYAAGLWDSDSLRDLSALFVVNPAVFRLQHTFLPDNATRKEIGNEFYQLWLDQGMSRSAALFDADDPDLERAQQRKYDRILDQLAPEGRLLDVGSGWGGLAERASARGHQVTGLTHSPSQVGYADARLDGRAEFRRQELWREADVYDNVVSIEFLNSVSPRRQGAFFEQVASCLAENGKFALQAIVAPTLSAQSMRPALPALSDLTAKAREAGLRVVDQFAFGDSYAQTFASWQERLETHAKRLSHMGFDTAFQKEWQFALATSSARFKCGQADVVQLQLAPTRARNS